MTTRKLAGAKHDRCIGHVAHPYPKSGKLCIGSSIGEAGMIAFADLMAERAAEHRAAFLAQPWPAPSAKARKVRVSPMPCADSVTRGSSVTLPELVERYRLMRAGEPAADSYVGAVARAHSRKARAPKVAGPVAVVVDGTVVAVTRHVEITEPAAPAPEPETHPYRFDDTIRHPGASRIDCPDCFTQDAPETATEPIAEPEPIRSTPTLAAVPSGRPTCPRCGQSFRKSGIGLAWHVANRPDCAAGRLAVA